MLQVSTYAKRAWNISDMAKRVQAMKMFST